MPDYPDLSSEYRYNVYVTPDDGSRLPPEGNIGEWEPSPGPMGAWEPFAWRRGEVMWRREESRPKPEGEFADQ